jgi:hypothetical protein
MWNHYHGAGSVWAASLLHADMIFGKDSLGEPHTEGSCGLAET